MFLRVLQDRMQALGAVLTTDGLACRIARAPEGAVGSSETRPHQETVFAKWITNANFGR